MEVNESLVVFLVAAVGVIATIISVVGPVVRRRVERWAEEQYTEMELNLPENIMAVIKEVARIAVIVVEATHLEEESRLKLKAAEEMAEAWLRDLGYEIELDRIREAIEYVLFEMKVEGVIKD